MKANISFYPMSPTVFGNITFPEQNASSARAKSAESNDAKGTVSGGH